MFVVLEKEIFLNDEDTAQQELERIHNELAGFRPIPQTTKAASLRQPPSTTTHSHYKKSSSVSSSNSKGRKSGSKMTYSRESSASYGSTDYY